MLSQMRIFYCWLKISNWFFSFRGSLMRLHLQREEGGCMENSPSNLKYCPVNWIPLPYFCWKNYSNNALLYAELSLGILWHHNAHKSPSPLSLKWEGKFSKAGLANQCRVAPLLGFPGQGQPPKWAQMIAWVKQPGFDLHSYVLGSKLGNGNDVSMPREHIWYLFIKKCTVFKIIPETEKFLLMVVAVVAMTMKVRWMVTVKISDCQSSNPAPSYNFECT